MELYSVRIEFVNPYGRRQLESMDEIDSVKSKYRKWGDDHSVFVPLFMKGYEGEDGFLIFDTHFESKTLAKLFVETFPEATFLCRIQHIKDIENGI